MSETNHFIEKIYENTWMIRETGSDGTAVYMYLLTGRERALLVDTGYGLFDLKAAVRKITDLPVTVILTHGHVDHIGACAQFDEVLLHKDDIECYRWHCQKEVREFFSLDDDDPYPKKEPQLIDESWKADLGDRKVSLIRSAGHTPGSVCVLDEKNRALFCGDACVRGNVLLCLKYAQSVNDYADGIRCLLGKKDYYDILWPGHHEAPLEKNILKELANAADMIISGKEKGEPLTIAGIQTYELKYGDIGILYPAAGELPKI